MTDPAHSHAHNDGKWRTIALVLLPIVGILLVIVAIYLVRPRDPGVVTVVYADGQAGAASVNVGDVLDATNPRSPVEPRLGYRYKVFIEDESEDRTSGIAKIGGRATFVPDARRGQTALVDVTRVRDRVVDAVLVRVLSKIDMPPKPAAVPFEPRPGDPAAHVVPGAEFDVVVSEPSSKNPETEGVAKVAGLVVFVKGATTIGERVNIHVVERRERMAFAELSGKPAGDGPLPSSSAAPVRRAFQPRPDDPAAHVVPGAEFDVVVSEPSSKNSETEGVAKVAGLVVFVKGATAIGERVNIRVVERRDRMAFAELSGKPAGDGPLPSSSPAPVRRVFQPRPDDRASAIVPGAELDLVVTENSEKNPGVEGVARYEGLVVFVQGATTIGERLNVRIVDRRERSATAVPTGKPVGAAAQPVPPAGDVVRRVFAPAAAQSSAPHVVAGAELDLEIVDLSKKNPLTEGVAKVDGLVVFVQGATNVGQTVRARISARRERMAFADAIAPANP